MDDCSLIENNEGHPEHMVTVSPLTEGSLKLCLCQPKICLLITQDTAEVLFFFPCE
jgi:hypothetical protein